MYTTIILILYNSINLDFVYGYINENGAISKARLFHKSDVLNSMLKAKYPEGSNDPDGPANDNVMFKAVMVNNPNGVALMSSGDHLVGKARSSRTRISTGNRRRMRYPEGPEDNEAMRYPEVPEDNKAMRYPEGPEDNKAMRYPEGPEDDESMRYPEAPDDDDVMFKAVMVNNPNGVALMSSGDHLVGKARSSRTRISTGNRRRMRYPEGPEDNEAMRYPEGPEDNKALRYPEGPEDNKAMRYPEGPEDDESMRYPEAPDDDDVMFKAVLVNNPNNVALMSSRDHLVGKARSSRTRISTGNRRRMRYPEGPEDNEAMRYPEGPENNEAVRYPEGPEDDESMRYPEAPDDDDVMFKAVMVNNPNGVALMSSKDHLIGKAKSSNTWISKVYGKAMRYSEGRADSKAGQDPEGSDENDHYTGLEANIEDYPYQVSFQSTRVSLCGGFIISKNYILTAAHCVQNVDPKTVILRAGSTSRMDGTIIPIAKITPHPEFGNPKYDKDVGVMKTAESIEFTNTIKPIGLPDRGRQIKAGTEVKVSGWGRLAQGSKGLPEHLMAVQIPVVKRTKCRISYFNTITNNMFCAGHYFLGGEDACQGDSGGAAAQDGLAVGIVSFGRGCGQPLSPGVFTDVAAPNIRDFITEMTEL